MSQEWRVVGGVRKKEKSLEVDSEGLPLLASSSIMETSVPTSSFFWLLRASHGFCHQVSPVETLFTPPQRSEAKVGYNAVNGWRKLNAGSLSCVERPACLRVASCSLLSFTC